MFTGEKGRVVVIQSDRFNTGTQNCSDAVVSTRSKVQGQSSLVRIKHWINDNQNLTAIELITHSESQRYLPVLSIDERKHVISLDRKFATLLLI